MLAWKIATKRNCENKKDENSQKFATKCLKLLHNSCYIISEIFVMF